MLTIHSLNDERPELSSTNTTRSYTEQNDLVPLFDATVELLDEDSCPEHRLIRNISIRLENPAPYEDVLLLYLQNDTEMEYSGLGLNFSNVLLDSSSPLGLEGYNKTFTCNQSVSDNCYRDFLTRLYYNNTAKEPLLYTRIFALEV